MIPCTLSTWGQGHSRNLTVAAEGLEGISHVSVFMHLCIYARTWHLSWPWFYIDKERTDAVDPSDFKTVTRPAGGPSPFGCPQREMTRWLKKERKAGRG